MEILGDYTIQKQLPKGAFGTVYLAEHRFLKRLFALKILPEEIGKDPLFLRRFEEEVALLSSLEHPHIAKIHNVSFAEGLYFLVTDPHVDSWQETMHLGRFLEQKGKSLSEGEKEALLMQVAEALDYAHGAGVFHGGLKLTNIFVAAEEKGPRLFLSDFGVVRLLGEGVAFSLLAEKVAEALFTQNREEGKRFVQAYAFLAPEQRDVFPKEVDAKADAYAFGVLAYWMLTQRLPEGYFELPSRIVGDLQGNWDLFLSRCLQPNPSVRPQKLVLALEEYLRAPKTVGKEWSSLGEVEKKLEGQGQMAFEFTAASSEMPKPLLNPQEIVRPQYEPDPAAIFQKELQVSRYSPKQVEVQEIEPILTEMVVVPGGTYLRGSAEGARDEIPRHAVHLPSFALDIHPVTNEQFVRFLEAMGGEKDQNNNDIIRLRDARIKKSAGKLVIESGYAKHPVVGVTWYGAFAYAKWVGKRLPTEAEWEAAATGGKEGFIYPTGAEIERSQANFFSSDTTAVMSYPPNALGLFDMAGNVYEWCQDWYAYNYYEASQQEPHAPKGPGQGVYRVLRGGCWKSLREDLRSSHRHRNNPGAVNGTYGFRCAADVS